MVGLSFAGMIVAMMQTLVVPIIGLIQHKLGTSASGVSWVITANLLAAAVMTPLLGRYGDQHGKRKVLLACLIMMFGGSLLAATTSSLALLIVGRVLQGAAAGIFPLAISVVRDEIRADKLPTNMAIISATLSVGGGVGLVATGLLTTGGDDYHNVFWLASALSALALVGVFFLVPDPRTTSPGRTDVLGALTLGAALVLLLMPLSQGNSWGWGSPAVIGCLVVAVVMVVVWARVERRVHDPLVDMTMFLHRPVLITNIAGLLLGFAMFGQFLGMADLVQIPPALAGYGFGASVLKASVLYLLPGALLGVIAAPGRSAHRPHRRPDGPGDRDGHRRGQLLFLRGLPPAALAGHRGRDGVLDRHCLRVRGHARADRRRGPGQPDRHRQRHQCDISLGGQLHCRGGHRDDPGGPPDQ